MQTTWTRTVGFCLAAAVVVSCGGASGGESQGDVRRTHRDAVIEAWGNAAVRGDLNVLVGLLEPRVRSSISAEQLDEMDSLGQPREVTVTDFGFEIVSEDAQSVEVRYTGERCAPTMTKTFGTTTIVGDASTASTSLSGEGTIVEGDVVCVDLEAEPGPLSPHRFVEVDGEWYGTFPGF